MTGTTSMTNDSIAAIYGSYNAVWFGKIIKIVEANEEEDSYITVHYFHREGNSTLYRLVQKLNFIYCIYMYYFVTLSFYSV